VSKSVTVSKLESLLARIRGRAAEPRPAASSAAPAVAPAVARAVPAIVAPPAAPPPAAAAPPPAPAPPVAAPVVTRPVQRVEPPPTVIIDQIEEATLPPPPMASDDFAVDVDMHVSTPPPPPMDAAPGSNREPSSSQERLSAAQAPSTEPPAVMADVADEGPSIGHGESLADEEALAGEERPEEAPISSRRPVAPPEERLAELAFGAGEPQPPRHTPPPKSGRLPAPPASEFDADVTGVRDAVALPTAGADVPRPAAQASRPAVLAPQAARPNLVSEPRVADVIGDAQAFAPSTFFELLDASLSL
jgi:hypothetical protein